MDSFLSWFWDDVRSMGGPCGLRLAACLPAPRCKQSVAAGDGGDGGQALKKMSSVCGWWV